MMEKIDWRAIDFVSQIYSDMAKEYKENSNSKLMEKLHSHVMPILNKWLQTVDKKYNLSVVSIKIPDAIYYEALARIVKKNETLPCYIRKIMSGSVSHKNFVKSMAKAIDYELIDFNHVLHNQSISLRGMVMNLKLRVSPQEIDKRSHAHQADIIGKNGYKLFKKRYPKYLRMIKNSKLKLKFKDKE